jgi:hypothetical protein
MAVALGLSKSTVQKIHGEWRKTIRVPEWHVNQAISVNIARLASTTVMARVAGKFK